MHYNTLLLNYDATEQDFQDYNIPRSVLAKLFTIRNHKKVTSHFAQNTVNLIFTSIFALSTVPCENVNNRVT